MTRIIGIVFLCLAACSNNAGGGGGGCESNSDCAPGWAGCVHLCRSDSDCDANQICTNDACVNGGRNNRVGDAGRRHRRVAADVV